MRNKLYRMMLAAAPFAAGAMFWSAPAQAQLPCLPNSEVLCLDQGNAWTNSTRASFYSTDQGSELMPYSWFKALKNSDGVPFDKSLERYGYLPDTFRSNGLPVGFTVSTLTLNPMLGMTCAACHTREIDRGGFKFRVDGGPAIVDFRGLLSDLIDSVGRVKDDDATFQAFAKSVLGFFNTPARRADLMNQVKLWYLREDTLRQGAYPDPDIWGLGRLDAVAMIFNRLTGLDIGEAPSYLIPENIQKASAPVRYPFLWNAAIQDKTQWPGFADNGSATLGMARNTGEVIGVFATFHPQMVNGLIANLNFSKVNSSNSWGLLKVEQLIRKIGAPKWPAQFPINRSLIDRGKAVYEQTCQQCHFNDPQNHPGTPGKPGGAFTWFTPIQDVGTDSHEWDILGWTAKPGVLGQLKIRFVPNFNVPDPSPNFNLLKYAVLGSMIDKGSVFLAAIEDVFGPKGKGKPAISTKGAFDLVNDALEVNNDSACPTGKTCYESRVMFGIWAAAPYLHNGSVPTMWDLLQPSSQRPVTFAVGPSYDPVKMGVAAEQEGSYTRTTTGCEAGNTGINSGNSRCGHEGPAFGTELPVSDKLALIEYLKTL